MFDNEDVDDDNNIVGKVGHVISILRQTVPTVMCASPSGTHPINCLRNNIKILRIDPLLCIASQKACCS